MSLCVEGYVFHFVLKVTVFHFVLRVIRVSLCVEGCTCFTLC